MSAVATVTPIIIPGGPQISIEISTTKETATNKAVTAAAVAALPQNKAVTETAIAVLPEAKKSSVKVITPINQEDSLERPLRSPSETLAFCCCLICVIGCGIGLGIGFDKFLDSLTSH